MERDVAVHDIETALKLSGGVRLASSPLVGTSDIKLCGSKMPIS
jgi:hypothetical protein